MDKTTKIIVWVVVLVVVVWLGYTYLNKPKEPVLKEVVKIGVIIPLSGSGAYYGEQSKKGIDLAKEEILRENPDLKLEIYYEDSQYNAKEGVNAYNKLRSVVKPDAVITSASDVSMATKPLAVEDNILQMAIWASVDKYASPDDLSFRTSIKSSVETAVMADFIKSKGYKKLGFVFVETDFGISFTNSLKEGLVKNNSGVQVIGEEGYKLDTNDFRTSLLKLKQAAPDAVYMIGPASKYGIILKQSNEIGFKTQFLSLRSYEDPVILQVGTLAEGAVYTYPLDLDSSVAEAQKFIRLFREKYDTEPDAYSGEAYEGLRLVVAAFSSCGKDPECLKGYFSKLEDYESIFGDISFDSNGDPEYPFFLKTVKDGKFVKYE